jgi:hypothetical protein
MPGSATRRWHPLFLSRVRRHDFSSLAFLSFHLFSAPSIRIQVAGNIAGDFSPDASRLTADGFRLEASILTKQEARVSTLQDWAAIHCAAASGINLNPI